MALSHVLRNIVAAEGCVVADNDLRSGKRYVLVDKELKNRPLKRHSSGNRECLPLRCLGG